MHNIPEKNAGFWRRKSWRCRPHLSVVLMESIDPSFTTTKWVTWLFNHEIGGFCLGHYFKDEALARKDFEARVDLWEK